MHNLKLLVGILTCCLLIQGCGSDDSETTDSGTQTPEDNNDNTNGETENGNETETDPAILSSWIINTSERSAVLREDGNGILTNVQSATETTANNEDFVRVQATGIPDYQVTMTQAIIDTLNNRQQAADDFVSGGTSASVGDVIDFGEDIGYKNTQQQGCVVNEGKGYWPPGPGCPLRQEKDNYFPVTPTNASENCETGLGAVGYAVNGVSIYNWSDGTYYDSNKQDGISENVWQPLAPFAESNDVDICGGHATSQDGGADYHHHFYSSCWGEVAGEDNTGHSEVIGFAADGYAVYGPWHDTNVLAKSSWIARDYESPASDSGCGVSGKRTCVLVDQYDLSQGTEDADYDGPDTSGTYTSQSGNEFDATSGFFFEDYYYDANASSASSGDGEEYLDQHNGHSHDDLGYHYHVTVSDAETLTPAFPFITGPTLKGEVASQATFNCNTGGMGPGPGNMQPPM